MPMIIEDKSKGEVSPNKSDITVKSTKPIKPSIIIVPPSSSEFKAQTSEEDGTSHHLLFTG